MSHTYKLIYFNIPGRGFPLRVALQYGNIPYEDERIQFPDWPKAKQSTPYGNIPNLVIDGKTYAHSNSLIRYIGKLAGLYPKDELFALQCDEILDACEELGTALVKTLSMQGEELKQARAKLNEGFVPEILNRMEKRLEQFGGKDFVTGENHISIADIKLGGIVMWLSSGVLDGIDGKAHLAKCPRVARTFEAIQKDPKINWAENHKKFL